MTSPSYSHSSLITSFCDLLLVSIHTILFEREVYPPSLFIAARKYNHPVQQARHPRLCNWIQDAVNACLEELLKGTVKHISVTIFSPLNKPLERFVFDVSTFPAISQTEPHAKFANAPAKEPGPPSPEDSPTPDAPPPLVGLNLEEQFRAVLTKLSYASLKLGGLPKDCTFTVALELKDGSPVPESNPSAWVAAEHRSVNVDLSKSGSIGEPTADTSRTVPVRRLALGSLFLEIWIEEVEGKRNQLAACMHS